MNYSDVAAANVIMLELREARKDYRKIRARSGQIPAYFDATVKALLESAGHQLTPQSWVAGARAAQFFCTRCDGQGGFVSRKNVHFTCFRCGGKGTQDDADVRRNYGYDMASRAI